MNTISIGNHAVGTGARCFIIAEAGSNHDGDFDQAKQLIKVAAEAGADAVKFQTFEAARIAAQTTAPDARIDVAGARSHYELYKKLEMPREWLGELVVSAKERGILFLSTPFDEDSVDYLDALGIEAFKIASYELVHLPLLQHSAKKGKPVILSTGMANLGEIEEARDTILAEGNEQIALLHCTVCYPTSLTCVNLSAIDTLRQAFQVPVGYSDHTLGITVPIAAVARGANVIEKHFTLDKNLPGPDHAFALDPTELRCMVKAIRDVETAIGSPVKRVTDDEIDKLGRGRRSLFAKVDIPAGATITASMLAVLRPGIGLKPNNLALLVGRKAAVDIEANEPIQWDMV